MRVSVLTAVVGLFVFGSASSGSAGPLDDLMACTNIGGTAERLACFDAAAATIEAKGGAAALSAAPPQAAPQPVTAEQRKKAEESAFGLRLPTFGLFGDKETEADFGAERLARPEEPERIGAISAGIEDYAFNGLGKAIFFLDNGQVWRQLDSDDGKIRLKKNEKYSVVIERGALGSYNLKVEGVGRFMKVKRIK